MHSGCYHGELVRGDKHFEMRLEMRATARACAIAGGDLARARERRKEGGRERKMAKERERGMTGSAIASRSRGGGGRWRQQWPLPRINMQRNDRSRPIARQRRVSRTREDAQAIGARAAGPDRPRDPFGTSVTSSSSTDPAGDRLVNVCRHIGFAGIAEGTARTGKRDARGIRGGGEKGVRRGGGNEDENSPVLYTCSSSTMPSLPPPNTTMRSLMATARCPCLGLGWGPVGFAIRFHFSMGAAMMTVDHIIFSMPRERKITLTIYRRNYPL